MSSLKSYPAVPSSDFVSSDLLALASHMDECAKSRSRFFSMQAVAEQLHSLTAPRIVSTAMVFVVCAISVLAFA